jgi:hypothetical protein
VIGVPTLLHHQREVFVSIMRHKINLQTIIHHCSFDGLVPDLQANHVTQRKDVDSPQIEI